MPYRFESGQKIPVCAGDGCTREGWGEVEERNSFGVYAGIYCGPCWRKSGFRDATDTDAVFDSADAGETMEPEPTAIGDIW